MARSQWKILEDCARTLTPLGRQPPIEYGEYWIRYSTTGQMPHGRRSENCFIDQVAIADHSSR
jgi:hypothetical protein